MGLVQSLVTRESSAMLSIGVLTPPDFSLNELFDAVQSGDTDTLPYMLDGGQVDLTCIDEVSGDTLLHRAISLGHGAITQLLMDKADNDPNVLNALDRQGYTPLMLAAAARNVTLMKALIDAGAGTDGSMNLGDLKGEFNFFTAVTGAKLCALTALFLIEARGDISKAFELAVKYEVPYAEKLYLDAGADAMSAAQHVPCPRGVKRMFDLGYVGVGDKLAILEQAKLTGHAELTRLLADYDELSSVLDHMQDRPDGEKIAVIRSFISAEPSRAQSWGGWALHRCKNFRGGKWSDDAFKPKHFDYLKLMVSAGAQMEQTLVSMTVYGERVAIQRLVESGADVTGAVSYFRKSEYYVQNNHAQYIDILTDAVTLKNLLQKDCALPEKGRIALLKVYIRDGMRDVANELIRDKVKAEHSLDAARLLILAGASATKALMDLGRETGDRAAARAIARQLIHVGADFAPAMNRLFEQSKEYKESGEPEAAKSALDAANLIASAALEHLLRADNMSEAEKISALKALMIAEAQPAVSELIRDTVKTGQSLDGVKLLILAGAWTTGVLMDLSREFTCTETMRRLIHIGANFLPAMKILLEHGEQKAANVLALAVATEHVPAGPSNPGTLYGRQ